MSEEQILTDVVSKWVSLAREYAGAADGVSAYYLYALHERIDGTGILFVNITYEQDGILVHRHNLRGTDTSMARQKRVIELMTEDLREATASFDREGIPAPTEYRVRYETPAGKVDVQLSRDIKIHGVDGMTPQDGLRTWLGDRTP